MSLISNETKDAILAKLRADAQAVGKTFESHTADIVAQLHTTAKHAIITAALAAGVLSFIVGLAVGLLSR